MYTALGCIVSQIVLNLGHEFHFRIVWRLTMRKWNTCPSSKRFVKQYNQELGTFSVTICFAKRLQSRPLKWKISFRFTLLFQEKSSCRWFRPVFCWGSSSKWRISCSVPGRRPPIDSNGTLQLKTSVKRRHTCPLFQFTVRVRKRSL